MNNELVDTVRTSLSGKRVLVTGHTGFKGAWLSLWLSELGAEVHGFALPATQPDGIYAHVKDAVFRSDTAGDITDAVALAAAVQCAQPDYVFHLAAQAVVREAYADPLRTLQTNILGSANVLEAVRRLNQTCHTIFVTSDKCYRNCEWHFSYRENDPLGGKDPYSMSKAAAELVAESWRRSYFDSHPNGSQVISVRAGNVIGGGDYAVDRLVPDCVRAALAGQPLVLRNPRATRPWQHVLDCLSGYLVVAAVVPRLPRSEELESFNFGPADTHAFPVTRVAEIFFEHWPNTPGMVIGEVDPLRSEAHYLSVSIEKSQRLLHWQPVWPCATAIEKAVEWYVQHHVANADMLAVSRGQIAQFTQAAQRDIG